MSGFEFSSGAQEAMRGDFILAGESPLPAATVRDFSLPEEPVSQLGSSGDLVEATKEYLDPTKPLSLDAQLQFNSLIMGAMGLRTPHDKLTIEQINELEQGYNDYALRPSPSAPGDNLTRLVVAPLFPSYPDLLENRQNMLRAIRENFSTALNDSQEPLTAPNVNYAYGSLLRNPNALSDKDNTLVVKTGLRYTSPCDDAIVDRQTYLDQLHDQDQVVAGTNKTLWTYNFVDVRPYILRAPGKDVRQLFGNSVDSTSSPEQEIAIQAMHLITGQQNTPGHVTITNEALYELHEADRAKTLHKATMVFWNPFLGQVHLDAWLDITPGHMLRSRASTRGL